VKLKVKRQKLAAVLKSGLKIEASCSEACTGAATLNLDSKLAKKLRLKAKLGTAKVVLAAAGRRVVVVRLSKAARAALKRSKRATFQVSASAADAAGNAAAAKPLKLTLSR
jgi:hypothetical protein